MTLAVLHCCALRRLRNHTLAMPSSDFCHRGHQLPALFVMGVQKLSLIHI